MPQTILVVDDEETARRFIERVLIQDGFQVLLASSGEEALKLLRSNRHKVSLVVTDLVMPGMGGHAFALEVARLPAPPPLLYISGYEAPEGVMAKRLLQKPFSPDELVTAIRKLLTSQRPV
jgi:two-component system cell cycle sensor histidine kinase/response regulator CckA